MKTIKRITRTVKLGVALGVAAITLSTYFASSATALSGFDPVDPTDLTIETVLDGPVIDEVITFFNEYEVTVSSNGCFTPDAFALGAEIENNSFSDFGSRFKIEVFDGTVEISETPQYVFADEPSFETDFFVVMPGDTASGPLPSSSNVALVRIFEEIILSPDNTLIHEEEVTICESEALAELNDAAEDYLAEVAAQEAIAAAEDEDELAEAAQAEAEALVEAAIAAQAQAEAEANEAKAALEATLNAVSVDLQESSTQSEMTPSSSQPLVEGESAVGVIDTESSKDSGLATSTILIVSLIGIVGAASAVLVLYQMKP